MQRRNPYTIRLLGCSELTSMSWLGRIRFRFSAYCSLCSFGWCCLSCDSSVLPYAIYRQDIGPSKTPYARSGCFQKHPVSLWPVERHILHSRLDVLFDWELFDTNIVIVIADPTYIMSGSDVVKPVFWGGVEHLRGQTRFANAYIGFEVLYDMVSRKPSAIRKRFEILAENVLPFVTHCFRYWQTEITIRTRKVCEWVGLHRAWR